MADDDVVACRGCGCTETTPCRGGCHWVTRGFCSACLDARTVDLGIPLVVLLAVHGNLLLALRHPQNTGPSRELAEAFVEDLEVIFQDVGVLTEEGLAEVHQVEAAEAPRIILARG